MERKMIKALGILDVDAYKIDAMVELDMNATTPSEVILYYLM